ncbi:hypothetical protein HDE_04847 [Halotydeus destructor]|nr:hypothetical protein HDE_04847 [Halotydeus destructor]
MSSLKRAAVRLSSDSVNCSAHYPAAIGPVKLNIIDPMDGPLVKKFKIDPELDLANGSLALANAGALGMPPVKTEMANGGPLVANGALDDEALPGSQLEDEAAATLLMLAGSSNDNKGKPVAQCVTSTSWTPTSTTSIPKVQNAQVVQIPNGGGNFNTYRVANGQLTKIVAVHRIETNSSLPYNQLIKVVKDLPLRTSADAGANGQANNVAKFENGGSTRILFQANGTYVASLPAMTINLPTGLTHTTAPMASIAGTSSSCSQSKLSALAEIASTSDHNSNNSKLSALVQAATSQLLTGPERFCTQGSSSSFLSQGSTTSSLDDCRPSTSSGNSSQDEDDDGSDSNSSYRVNKKSNRRLKYPRPEGTEAPYNPVKEFRNRQRQQHQEEDVLLAQLEAEYVANTKWTMTLDDLYVKHELVELLPEKTEKRVKRKEAENVEEKKERKRLQARRDSKNYREREKRRREFITKRIKLLQYLRTRAQVVDTVQAEQWAVTLHNQAKKNSELSAGSSGSVSPTRLILNSSSVARSSGSGSAVATTTLVTSGALLSSTASSSSSLWPQMVAKVPASSEPSSSSTVATASSPMCLTTIRSPAVMSSLNILSVVASQSRAAS